MTEMFAEAMALGIAKFRSAAEEEQAKADAANPPAVKKEGKNDGFNLAGFILGG